MHLLVPIALLVPIVLGEIVLAWFPRFAAALAWLPARSVRRSVPLPRGAAYRTAPASVFERIALPQMLVTVKNERLHLDVARGTGWVSPRGAKRSNHVVRVQIVDDEEGFRLVASSFPTPVLGMILGCVLAGVLLVEVRGAFALVLPAIAIVMGILTCRTAFVEANETVERVGDALAAHIVAERERAARIEAAPFSNEEPASEDDPASERRGKA